MSSAEAPGRRRDAASRQRRATYQDVLDAPPHRVAEIDLHGKRPIYAREGVAHLWLVDPVDRTLEAFELRKGEWVLIATAEDDDPVRIRPFEAVSFSLGDLWP